MEPARQRRQPSQGVSDFTVDRTVTNGERIPLEQT
jgi:hypothetical protein